MKSTQELFDAYWEKLRVQYPVLTRGEDSRLICKDAFMEGILQMGRLMKSPFQNQAEEQRLEPDGPDDNKKD